MEGPGSLSKSYFPRDAIRCMKTSVDVKGKLMEEGVYIPEACIQAPRQNVTWRQVHSDSLTQQEPCTPRAMSTPDPAFYCPPAPRKVTSDAMEFDHPYTSSVARRQLDFPVLPLPSQSLLSGLYRHITAMQQEPPCYDHEGSPACGDCSLPPFYLSPDHRVSLPSVLPVKSFTPSQVVTAMVPIQSVHNEVSKVAPSSTKAPLCPGLWRFGSKSMDGSRSGLTSATTKRLQPCAGGISKVYRVHLPRPSVHGHTTRAGHMKMDLDLSPFHSPQQLRSGVPVDLSPMSQRSLMVKALDMSKSAQLMDHAAVDALLNLDFVPGVLTTINKTFLEYCLSQLY